MFSIAEGFRDEGLDPYHSKRNSWETRSLKLTRSLNNFSAIFFTPTFDWAIIQHGRLWDTHIDAAAAIVVVFPVPGGPV
jgi:hypothetical protein